MQTFLQNRERQRQVERERERDRGMETYWNVHQRAETPV